MKSDRCDTAKLGTPDEADSNITDAKIVAMAFRDQLLAQSTNRGRRSVERIWTVCAELIAANKPLTVARIGRETEARWGSPKAQSIRDQPTRLKRLVDLCVAVQRDQGGATPVRSAGSASLEAMLAEVGDQSIRAKLRAMAEERDNLRRDLTILRQAYQRLAPIDELTAEQCYDEAASMSRAPQATSPGKSLSDASFTDAERSAVRRFLDEDFLFDEGFKIDSVQGLIREESGRIVLPAAFVTALRKLVN